MRERYCKVCKGWHNMAKPWPYECYVEKKVARSHLGFPHIYNDSFDEPVQSQADGNYYSSKAALRATYRADGNPQGVEYIEVGDERPKKVEAPEPTDKELIDIWDKAEARVARGETF